nr:hypothetical protein CFP56_12611 [Quercus suber]
MALFEPSVFLFKPISTSRGGLALKSGLRVTPLIHVPCFELLTTVGSTAYEFEPIELSWMLSSISFSISSKSRICFCETHDSTSCVTLLSPDTTLSSFSSVSVATHKLDAIILVPGIVSTLCPEFSFASSPGCTTLETCSCGIALLGCS